MTTESILYKNGIKQRRTQTAAFVMAAILCGLFSVFLTASHFAGTDSIYNPVLEGKINPNEAASASLMRLPNIGPKRAEAIIEYRESVNSELPVFQQSADLEKIKGIGPKTVEKIDPWLCFE